MAYEEIKNAIVDAQGMVRSKYCSGRGIRDLRLSGCLVRYESSPFPFDVETSFVGGPGDHHPAPNK